MMRRVFAFIITFLIGSGAFSLLTTILWNWTDWDFLKIFVVSLVVTGIILVLFLTDTGDKKHEIL